MNHVTRDNARRFQRERIAAVYGGNEAKAALKLGITRQALAGRQAVRYDELAKWAEDPNANPEAIPLGALEVIQSVRAEGDVFALARQADDWMTRAQVSDGAEDCKQLDVKVVLGSFAFMHGTLNLPLRAKAVEALEAWRRCKRAEMAADLAALGYVDALISKLSPTGEGR